MLILLWFVFMGFFTWLIISSSFKLLGLSLGSMGVEGIIAFWFGMAMLWGVGTLLGAW